MYKKYYLNVIRYQIFLLKYIQVYSINLNVKTCEEYKFLIDLIFYINFIKLKKSKDTATLGAKLTEKIKKLKYV